MSSKDKLSELRRRIDALDEQIQTLINERAACAQAVADIKLADGAEHYYRPEREVAILRRVSERNTGPMPSEEMVRLFREINARGTTVVVATHDRDLIQRMQRRTVVLEGGAVIDAGETA